MVNKGYNLTRVDIEVDLPFEIVSNTTVLSITMVENLLTPGLQTSVQLDSFFHNPDIKDYDIFKYKVMGITITTPGGDGAREKEQVISGRIYRQSNRRLINDNNEKFTLHLCDDSLLIDAVNMVSKSWKCETPDAIVDEVLQECLGVDPDKIKIMPGTVAPARDYIAQNIHPLQVINQQATVAMDGDEPSFLHYMTYEDMDLDDPRGTHYFRSLKNMVEEADYMLDPYIYAVAGEPNTYNKDQTILTYSFPCDFDILSDLLNGIDENGEDITSIFVINPKIKAVSMLGNDVVGCGLGAGPVKTVLTNIVSALDQDSCPTDVEHHMLLRQARMSLLEQDKIAFRCTIPWNPDLHVGNKIKVILPHKTYHQDMRGGTVGELYGSDTYLIVGLVHNILNGGYSTTTLDCITKTAGARGFIDIGGG